MCLSLYYVRFNSFSCPAQISPQMSRAVEKSKFSRMSFRHCEKWRLVKKLVHKRFKFNFNWELKNVVIMMLIPKKWIDSVQISPKNLRLSAILISIYEIVSCEKVLIFNDWLSNHFQLIAHVIMFVMLLGLINAEKAQKLLMEDIDDQKEMEDYYYYPAVNNRGETLDIVRLNSATKLASSTILKLTIGTAIATIYLLVCLGLFAGVIKNRSHLIIPWMVFDVVVSLMINSVLVIIGTSMLYERFAISEWLYCE